MGHSTNDIKARMQSLLERSINEEEFIDELDIDFINKRSITNAFKLDTKDLQSIKYKSEIRFLISRKYFPELGTSDIFLPKLTNTKDLNNSISTIKALNDSALEDLLQLNTGSGLGPGEALLYFILDNASLGGGASAGVDLIDNGTKYEIKAVNFRRADKMLYDFKLGGTVDISHIQSRLMHLKKTMLKEFPKVKEGEKTGINNDHIKAFQNPKFKKIIKDRDDLTSYEDLEKEFAKLAYNSYFKTHPIIFIGNKDSGKYTGMVLSILNVKEKDIKIHKVTSSTIKPGVITKNLDI